MHPSPVFKVADRETAHALIAANPFAMLAVNGENGPSVALVPMLLSDDGLALKGHLGKANPLWRAAESGPVSATAVFQGGNSYISPGWYPSKAEHGRVVPTWNYRAVEFRGTLSVLSADEMMTDVKHLTRHMEKGQRAPWRVSDAPDDYVVALQRGIVGFRLSIQTLNAVDKLSQNKSVDDRAGVARALAASPRPGDRALADHIHPQEPT